MNCNKCNETLSDLMYRRQKNNTLHLVGWCSECGWKYLPLTPNLDILVTETYKDKLPGKKS